MAWMSDEQYELMQDTKEKKITARSARYTRTHCGKGGAVKFPSDYLSAKEIKKMNGECKSYRMNDPITWNEFKTWPEEHQKTYIKLIRAKYNAPDKYIAEMMGISRPLFCKVIVDLGLGEGKGKGGRRVWDKDRFLAWYSGAKDTSVEASEAPVEEVDETPVEEADEIREEMPVKAPTMEQAIDAIANSDAQPLLKFENEDHGENATDICSCEARCLVPCNGEMTFEGNVYDILRTISRLLDGKNVHLNVKWDVLEEDMGEPEREHA